MKKDEVLKKYAFKKGQSGNPGGKPKLPRELRDIKQYTTPELQRIISKYFRMNKVELLEAGLSESLPMIEVAIARTLHVAAKNGDFARITPLVERICGKVKDHLEFENIDTTKTQVIISLPDNGRSVSDDEAESNK